MNKKIDARLRKCLLKTIWDLAEAINDKVVHHAIDNMSTIAMENLVFSLRTINVTLDNYTRRMSAITPTSEVFSVRSRNVLARMGVQTLGDLAEKTEAEILNTKSFGETSFVELQDALRAAGLSFKTPAPKQQASASAAGQLVKPLKRKQRVNRS